MSCDKVQELVSPFLDGQLSGKERENMSAHTKVCRPCAFTLEAAQSVRASLRPMVNTPVPSELAVKLRVLASHEYHRRESRATLAKRIKLWLQPIQLFFDNLMRPMALPFAGGLFAAMFSFAVLVPSLTFHHAFGDQELFTGPDGEVIALGSDGTYVNGGIPTILRVDTQDPAVPADANVVVLFIDQNGRVSDWSVAQGTLTPDLQDMIMFSQFKPATFLGLPMSGTVTAVQLRAVRRRGLRS